MSVQLTGTIAPYPNGQYPVQDALLGIDGWRSVADHTTRDAIPDYLRRQGMAVWTQSDSVLWTLNASPWSGTDSDWTEFSGGGGNGTGTVTSVALTVPAGFSVTGSPITTNGTLAISSTLNGIIQCNGSAFSTVTVGSGLTFSGGSLSANTNGTVTSVALSVPTGFTVSGSPVTSSGTLAISSSINGIVQCNGSAFSAITVGSGLSFTNSTLSSTSSNTNGTVTSVGVSVPSWLAVVNSPVTTSGTIAISAASSQTANEFLATPNGSSGSVSLRAIAAADLPTTGLNITSHYGTITSDTDGSTITFNLSTSDWHTVTLGGNRTLAVSNPTVGQQFSIILVQDGSGSRTVTWFSTVKWPGGTVPTLSTAAGAIDVFTFKCVSSGNYYGFVIGQAMA